MTERFTTLSSAPLHSGSELRRCHEVKLLLFQLPLHHNNARFQYICRFQRVEIPTRFCGEVIIRSRRFYGGGAGFLLCFAAERKRCAPGSSRQFSLTISCAFSERATPKGRFTPGICRISLRTFREASSRKGQGYGMNAAAVPCASRRRDFRKGGTF